MGLVSCYVNFIFSVLPAKSSRRMVIYVLTPLSCCNWGCGLRVAVIYGLGAPHLALGECWQCPCCIFTWRPQACIILGVSECHSFKACRWYGGGISCRPCTRLKAPLCPTCTSLIKRHCVSLPKSCDPPNIATEALTSPAGVWRTSSKSLTALHQWKRNITRLPGDRNISLPASSPYLWLESLHF